MSFPTPTLKELIQQAQADIAGELQGTSTLSRRSFLRALAIAQAGLAFLMFGFLRRYIENAFPWSAKGTWLLKWASWWSAYAPKEADYAAGDVAITGTNGSVLPQGTLISRSTGKTYETQADATIAAGVATVAVKASDAGIAGNLEAGTALSLVSPVAGINADMTVAVGGITNGSDAEREDDFRVRWTRHVQSSGNGVLEEDFVDMALEVPGVTRAWAYENRDGPGTVAVFFVRDNDPSGIIPNAAAVAEMQAYLSHPSRKPICITVNAYAPVPKPVDLTVRLVPNTEAVRAQAQAEVDDLTRREAVVGKTVLLSHYDEAISLAAGEVDHDILSPEVEPVVAPNEILLPGTVTWVG
jgi:uncharacterized phage protein gp47/JayE